MRQRLKMLGAIIALMGIGFMIAGGVALARVQEGYNSLNSFSEAQSVTLSYNEDGQLVDRGTVEGAEKIMHLLTEEWGFPVVESDFDPNDPVINTASEFMYQMATISTHVLHGTQTITLTEDVEYNGETFEAGTYEFDIDGRYYSQFDRKHPLEGPARSMAWSPNAFGLISQLGVGAVTHSTLQMGLALAGLFGGLGGAFLLTGFGLVWVGRKKDC